MIVGIDIGGTHTDSVCVDGRRVRATAKTVTGDDLVRSIREAIEALDIDCSQITRTVLSTTLSTNSIIERKYAPAGMIVSAGPGIDPRRYFFTSDFHLVQGAIDHRGREYVPINPQEVSRVAGRLKEKGIRGVGIVSKFSVRNPSHEIGIHSLINSDFEHVSLGHTLSGSLNFPRRIHTTYFNTAVMPVQKHFVHSVRQALAELGIRSPLFFLKADGGTFSDSAADRHPVETILSGPAASMMGGLALSSDPGMTTLMLDIGGTTTDIGVLIGGLPILEPAGVEIGGLKTLVRGLKVVSVGAGGDSRVSLEDGRVQVGPLRDGPPACMGGPSPTPMDALSVLGMYEGGDRAKAEQALLPLAKSLDRALLDLCREIVSIMAEKIRSSAEEFVAEVNRHPVYTIYEMLHPDLVEPRQVMAIGGPAEEIKPFLEEAFGLPCVVPEHAMVANALGAALARTTRQITLTADTQLGRMVCPELGIEERITPYWRMSDLKKRGEQALRENAERLGLVDLGEISVIEEQEFNIVRGFSTTGKNLRLKLQTKPGVVGQWGAQ
ncbi:MAG: hydantoinase/oxoprolinase family protein [Desulfomonilia bacterium]|jgi:N-methylhydantoinase A